MSAYGRALKLAPRTQEIVRQIHGAMGRDKNGDPCGRSGHCLRLAYMGMRCDVQADCVLEVVYGDIAAVDKDTVDYLVRAVNLCMPQIAETAIALAKENLAKARKDARAEAMSVLAETGENNEPQADT